MDTNFVYVVRRHFDGGSDMLGVFTSEQVAKDMAARFFLDFYGRPHAQETHSRLLRASYFYSHTSKDTKGASHQCVSVSRTQVDKYLGW